MKILVAPNSMKGTLNAVEFADAITQGLINSGHSDIIKLPVADGGDGTAKLLASSLNAQYVKCLVKDPFFRDINSGFYINKEKVAIIEMADASGLKLLKPAEYSAINTTSFGTGQLIKSAIDYGAKSILLGVGGSATVDAGMGALMALGVCFYNYSNRIELGCGATIGDVTFIDFTQTIDLIKNTKLIILSDVKNPLLGKKGASNIFAKQKGASISEVKLLNKNLSLFCGVLFQTTGEDVSKIEYGGAAGGIGASFKAIYNADIIGGPGYVLNTLGFYENAKTADVIVTGEGKIDFTSLNGKASEAILNYGMEIDKPVYGICAINDLHKTNRYKDILSINEYIVEENDKVENTFEQVVKLAEKLGQKLKN